MTDSNLPKALIRTRRPSPGIALQSTPFCKEKSSSKDCSESQLRGLKLVESSSNTLQHIHYKL